MFNKLRNRFLVLNLVTLSIMMLGAFAAIYLIMYSNVHQNINMDLHRLEEFSRKPGGKPDQQKPEKRRQADGRTSDSQQAGGETASGGMSDSGPAGGSASDGGAPDMGPGKNVPADPGFVPDRSVSFFILTDSQWNISKYQSVFDMDSDFYESAVSIVSSQGRDTGSFKLDGNNWAYIVSSNNGGYRISFLDITSQQGILNTLTYTFLFSFLGMLVILYFISRFFSNRYIRPVREAFDKQKQFIADASHELKTPLAVINTNADVLLSFGEDTINSQAKWVQYIKNESLRMTKLTNDLLYLTRLDYSDSRAVFSKFNLSNAVENAILTMEGVIFEHQLSLNYDMEPDLSINGSSEQISEVSMILLDNAVKYSDANGSIDIHLRKRNNDAVLTVSNTGAGIPEEHLPNIFDRFYRTDKSRARRSDGYGLGLAIAKAIVDQHGGKICVKSVVNEKTTFSVELPLA
jgi:signal transduction histidine kinase